MPSTNHRRTERASLTPLSVAMCFAVLIASSTVTAQVAAPLTPPVAIGSTDVPYPLNAIGDAVVLIVLVVEKDGTVSSAQVVVGAEPFAEQARTAVLTWRFSPARRGDTVVAARIRARVEFHQDKAPDASAPDGAQPPAAAAVPGTPAPDAAALSRAPHPAGPTTARGAPQSPAP